jgi:hypothetical protein
MTNRATIQSQVDQVRRLYINTPAHLEILEKGISKEPMAFDLTSLHHLRVLAAAIDRLTQTCDHVLEDQRLEAQSKARSKKSNMSQTHD